MSEDLVFPRDASSYERPNVRSAKVLHWESSRIGGRSACGRSELATGPTFAVPADGVHESRRCRRPGCRERWAGREGAPS